jgi:Bacterial Ig domain
MLETDTGGTMESGYRFGQLEVTFREPSVPFRLSQQLMPPMIVPVNRIFGAAITAIIRLGLLCCVSACAFAQARPNGSEPESYRLRIENIQFGRIEISMDAGKHYLLIGRVLHAATAMAQEAAASAGSVVRSSQEGLAFSPVAGQVLKLRPAPAAGGIEKAKDSEIISNIAATRPLWSRYLAPAKSTVQNQPEGHDPGDFIEGYVPSTTDRFLITASLPLPDPPIGVGLPVQTEAERKTSFNHALRAAMESIAADYRDTAVARAVADKRKVTSGTLSLHPNISPDEPDPITAITYAIDDTTVCARTTPPYLFGWDTTSVPDGEHVIEVRALNAAGGVITRTRYLIVVKNAKDPAS